MKKIWAELNKFYIGVFFTLIGFVAGIVYFQSANYSKKEEIQRKHINNQISIGRQCSSCHFGLSFIDLLNNKNIIANDNIFYYILDEIKVKRW